MNRCLRKAVWLCAGVQSEHVRLVLLDADETVLNWCKHEKENRAPQNNQWQDGEISKSTNLPLLSPASQRPLQRRSQQGKAEKEHNPEEDDALVNVVQDVVSHFVSHDRLNLFGRSAFQQVVI